MKPIMKITTPKYFRQKKPLHFGKKLFIQTIWPVVQL